MLTLTAREFARRPADERLIVYTEDDLEGDNTLARNADDHMHVYIELTMRPAMLVRVAREDDAATRDSLSIRGSTPTHPPTNLLPPPPLTNLLFPRLRTVPLSSSRGARPVEPTRGRVIRLGDSIDSIAKLPTRFHTMPLTHLPSAVGFSCSSISRAEARNRRSILRSCSDEKYLYRQ